MSDIDYRPHTSADRHKVDYVDDRGIRILDADWQCPNCGDDGELMFRPGSKNTCARCFWVLNGSKNDLILNDWQLKYRDAQRLLASLGEPWHGTPGSVSNRLRQNFDRPEEAEQAWRDEIEGDVATDGGSMGVTLGDFQ